MMHLFLLAYVCGGGQLLCVTALVSLLLSVVLSLALVLVVHKEWELG